MKNDQNQDIISINQNSEENEEKREKISMWDTEQALPYDLFGDEDEF